ncbi:MULTISPECIES: hypothetical protein [Pseudomonas]|uniref:Uncharacterized protein n=1 Tax=Pseudomonas quercus TaxID=2722792 RepID=A0ABX0YFI8_9PSED|nr:MULTISPECIES: hypothetical protein [Pseudomonas]MBF7143869.1 hypothetical protein [Pseudomonas sp. LY10J]NJP02052.1 hypothetical protein [Pseudomonas quercus]
MLINITRVTKTEATVCGQVVTREYAEAILLPMLVSQCGTLYGRQIEIIKAFTEAGLSTSACPEATKRFRQDQQEKAQERARAQAEAQWHAERCYEPTERELAQAKADREASAAAIRAYGEQIRAARRSSY